MQRLRQYDVAIAGGGPGGCATALSLRAHAPSLSVVIVEASQYEAPRIGETLPPVARRMLEHLGVWRAFREQGHREVYGTAAAWGTAIPQDNDFILTTHGPGWHLDRAAFDAMLASEVERRGATLLVGTRVCDAHYSADAWQLRLSNRDIVTARFLVDATGTAIFARRCGARFVTTDRLASFVRFFADAGDGDPRTLVESFADGWWYTAGLPSHRRIAACITDSDFARRTRLADPDAWTRLLATMPVVSSLVRTARADGAILVRSTPSRHLTPTATDTWLAVGDSASTFDSLSSQGITKALRSGIFASYAITDTLTRSNTTGLARYDSFARAEFDSYCEVRTKYYQAERRWSGTEWWEKRLPRKLVAGEGFLGY